MKKKTKAHLISRKCYSAADRLTMTLTIASQSTVLAERLALDYIPSILTDATFLSELSTVYVPQICQIVFEKFAQLPPMSLYKLLMVLWHDKCVVRLFAEAPQPSFFDTSSSLFSLDAETISTLHKILLLMRDSVKKGEWANLDASLLLSCWMYFKQGDKMYSDCIRELL